MILGLPFDLFWLFLIIAVSLGSGQKILNYFFRDSFPDRWLGILFSLGVGLAFLSFAVLFIGLAGGLYPWVFYGLFTLLLVWSWGELRSMAQAFCEAPALIRRSLTNRFEFFLMGLLIMALLSNLVFNYSPPTQVREMMYDLTLPKIFLSQRKIVEVPDQLVFYYPLQIQMLYLLAITVKGAMLAKLIHFSLGIFSLVLVARITSYFFGQRPALYSSVLFYLMPIIGSLSGTANIDLGTLFYGLLTAALLFIWYRNGDMRYLYLGGFFSGVTVGTKVTGLTIPLTYTLLVFSILVAQFKDSARLAIKKIFWVGALSFLGFAPWVFRNVYSNHDRNPVAPFGISLLGLKAHEATQLNIDAIEELESRLTWKDTLQGLHNIHYGDFIYGSGPLVFALLIPALLSKSRKSKDCLVIFIFALLAYLILFILLPYPHRFYENRYYIISLALCAVLAGVGMEAVLEMRWNKLFLIAGFSGCLIFPCLIFNVLLSAGRFPVFFGVESSESYLKRKLPFYQVVEYANEKLSKDSRVLMLGSSDAHSYYWNARTVGPSIRVMKERDPNKLLKMLKQDQISHLLIFNRFYEWLEDERVYRHKENRGYDLHWNPDTPEENYFLKIYDDPDVSLYRLKGDL